MGASLPIKRGERDDSAGRGKARRGGVGRGQGEGEGEGCICLCLFFFLQKNKEINECAASWSSGSEEESVGPERRPNNGTELETTLAILKG